MCKLMEDYGERIAKRVAERAAMEAAAESVEKSKRFAVGLWNDGMRDLEKISRITELPLGEVKKLFDGKIA